MFPSQVEVIKGERSIVDRKNKRTMPTIRVAPYCRVSTDSEEQAKSYNSQLTYYEELVKSKKEWTLVDIYADEAVSGTRDDKREDFIRMIKDCKAGLIDMIITKSISRFARNTVDTLSYVRMLKEIQIAVFFEEENINTLTMDGELLLTILSSVAQQEVENTSANVKKGLKMKMKRGELIGYNGCLGYDYDKETKSLSINEQEAKIVRYIFERYLEGFGCYIIARELGEKGFKTKKGNSTWRDTSVAGILKNEKYKGDILQGKTFTLDPISKRRLDNFGEEDKFYISNHHAPIISAEDWNKAQVMLQSRGNGRRHMKGEKRAKHSRKYAFSSMLECGFCHSNLSRRSWNANSPGAKSIWQCVKNAKDGKRFCPHAKGIPETVIEGAFLKSYELLCQNKREVLDEFLERLNETLQQSEINQRIKVLEKEARRIEAKRSKLTDMWLDDDEFDKNEYKSKYGLLSDEYNLKCEELEMLKTKALDEKDMSKRISDLKELLESDNVLESFDGQVFETVIEKVIVGEINEQGEINPYKLTFIYRTGINNGIDISNYIGRWKKSDIDQSSYVAHNAY